MKTNKNAVTSARASIINMAGPRLCYIMLIFRFWFSRAQEKVFPDAFLLPAICGTKKCNGEYCTTLFIIRKAVFASKFLCSAEKWGGHGPPSCAGPVGGFIFQKNPATKSCNSEMMQWYLKEKYFGGIQPGTIKSERTHQLVETQMDKS